MELLKRPHEMGKPLRVLVAEDSEDDAELVAAKCSAKRGVEVPSPSAFGCMQALRYAIAALRRPIPRD